MPTLSKQVRMLEEVAVYHVQQKRARTQYLVSHFLDDLPSSDSQASKNSDSSSSSSSLSLSSSISFPSSGISDPFTGSSPSRQTYSGRSSISSDDLEFFNDLEDQLLEQWDTQIHALATYLLTACVLEACPPVKKLSQMDLVMIKF